MIHELLDRRMHLVRCTQSYEYASTAAVLRKQESVNVARLRASETRAEDVCNVNFVPINAPASTNDEVHS